MIHRSPVIAAVVAVIALSGCGGKTAQTGASQSSASQTTAGDDAGSARSVCGWPASLDPGDASVLQCVAASYYLRCAGSGGGGELCVSNDPTQCPGGDPVVGETYSNCQDQCSGDEYAVACGGPGPTPAPVLPAGCRALPSNPGGGVVGCCPCVPASAPHEFACGSSMCDATSQICEHVEGGVAPGTDFLECIAIPAQCASDVSCSCVDEALLGRGADGCTETGGGLTVLITVP